MATIKFERRLHPGELRLKHALMEMIEHGNFHKDVRGYRGEVEGIMEELGIRGKYLVGNGSSHVWIHRKRLGESDKRWAIIIE